MSNKTDIASLLTDNTIGDITPTKVRQAFDIVDPEQQSVPASVSIQGANPVVKMKLDDAGHSAQMQVIHKGHNVATMEYLPATQEFIFSLADKGTGVTKATFEIKPNGKAYIGGKEIATETMIREFRTTIVQDIADHAKPTQAECITTFKKLPHFDWKRDDDYYIKDTSGGKIVLIKYRGKAAATEAKPGNFFYEVLTKAK